MDFADGDLSRQCKQSARMVVVAMGDDYGIKFSDTPGLQIRKNGSVGGIRFR